ncbi:MAG: hypothetical protein COW00_07250 [Bdellovibrio sp. CG12_big_fil_rev_8_21_14_0_65_39_13]|nr:MAG: hypothetical protein COW78_16970 [Bdellovibrio sp. CG22_combo_CG10-13_8_21_14_all_39_27]PIQ60283.1 MAG: hypothetical protein COW00_07250 [Bdellovibrio sp. CG12_big_fil_rev_8_21_14_0_65_39_13]PIR34719.1 MAG: hypothetical protein COV37_12355 [Bdellovibrio sp. CG11_big_fil_rev_8_21_14_0_20_39_38]PJB53310.1 MAG: hypothetical protein CO099_07785 [Bdellovibrio sp. CG_4_9_14_3_um_filter_39_7]
MHVIKNPVRLQKHLFGKVDLLKEVVNTFVETNSRESLDEVIVSKIQDIYEDLRKGLDTEETITLHNYLKDCSEVCSCALLMPENVKASKKLVNLLSESVDILDQLTNSLTDPTARIVVRNRIKSAHVQVDRLNRTEYYDVWKERQKAS